MTCLWQKQTFSISELLPGRLVLARLQKTMILPIQNIIPAPLFCGRNKVNPLKEALTQCRQAGR